jgi:hypothetical protein
VQDRRVSTTTLELVLEIQKLTFRDRYDVALLYLEQADYNLEHAITAYKADEDWEKEHSLEAAKKGKAKNTQSPGRRKWGFGGLTGQL